MRRIARIPIVPPTIIVVFVALASFAAQAADTTHRARSAQSAGFADWISDASGRPMNFAVPSSPDNWLGGSGNWSNGADWSAGEPGGSSDVFINTGNDYVMLDQNTSANINSLTLGGSSGSSTLLDPNQGGGNVAITIAGALTINQTGTLTLESGDSISAGANSSNAGSITLNGASMTVNGNLMNSGGIGLELAGRSASLTVTGNLINTGGIGDPTEEESLTVGGALTNSAGLEIGTLNVHGAFTNSCGLLDCVSIANGGSAGSLSNSGYIAIGDIFGAGTITNSGTIIVTPINYSAYLSTSGSLTNTSTGQIVIAQAGLSAASVANSGSLGISDGGVTVDGSVTNSGTLSAYNSRGQLGYRLINQIGGVLELSNDSMITIYNLANAGTVSVSDGATLTLPPGPHAAGTALGGFVNSGMVQIGSGATVTSGVPYTQLAGQTTVDGQLSGNLNFAGGSVYGNGGTLIGDVTSNASFNIGDEPMTVGQLTINGNYTQGANGSLTFDIASLTQYDQLNVSGHAQLNGLMTVNLLNSYIPQVGNMFDIMNFASESGTFSTVVGLPINNQEHFTLQYNPTNLTLDVVSGQGTPMISGRGNSFGGSSSSEPFITPLGDDMSFVSSDYSAPQSSVPEPGSILLFGSGIAGVGAFLRRTRFL